MQEAAGNEIVLKLSTLLRKHGDHIINGDSKLCLTVSSLVYLNSCFTQLKSGNHLNGESSANDELSSVAFLFEFLQKALSLKLVPGTCSRFDILVNISCFKNLQYLEIKKVPLGYIVGLQSLRTQLKGLKCIRSVIALNEVFISCGGDLSSTPYVWGALEEANLSYNGIEHLDDSLKVLPKLEVLNLSHNSIECSDRDDYWQFVSDLHYLNLGFNQLDRVPFIPSAGIGSSAHLTILILRNNNLHNLEGVQHFTKLEMVDVSYNCIATFQELSPLPQLEKLTSLCLEGNPVCFHSDYRAYTVACLSPLQRPDAICLDGKPLTILEQSCVGSNVQPASMLSYIPTEPLGKPRNLAFVNTPEDVMEASQDFADGVLASSAGRKHGSKGRKKLRTRQISLVDAVEESPSTSDHTDLETSIKLSTDLEMSLEHSEDIRRLEKARDLGGKHWLPAVNRVVHGETSSAISEPQSQLQESSSAYLSDEAEADDELDGDTEANTEESRARSESSSSVESLHSDDEVHQPFLVTLRTLVTDPSHEEDEETELLVTVTQHFIRERDVSDGKVLYKLETGSLLSVELEETEGGELVVHLKFDYLSRDRKERHYIMEDASNAQQLLDLLQPIARANEKANVPVAVENLECLKCSAQFTASSKSRDQPVCPDCGSTRIIQIAPPDESAGIPYPSRDLTQDSLSRDSPRGLIGANLNDSSIRTIDSNMSVTVLVPFSSSGSRPSSHEEEKRPRESWVGDNSFTKATQNTTRYSDSKEGIDSTAEKTDYESKTFTIQKHVDFSVNDREGSYVTKSSPPVRTSALSSSLQSSKNNIERPRNGDLSEIPAQKRVLDSPISLKTSSKVAANSSVPSSTDSSTTKDSFISLKTSSRVAAHSSVPSSTDSSTTKDKQPEVYGSPKTRLSRSLSPNPNILKSLFSKLSGKMAGVSSSMSSSQGSSSSESQGARPVVGTPRLGFKVSPDEFRQFDHSLQLYCEVSLFREGRDETCACLLKAPVVVYGTTEEITAILIASEKAVYICKLIEVGGGSPGECLTLMASNSLESLRYIDVGLHSQSFRIEFDGDRPGCYAFNVRDRDRCEEFLQIFIKFVEEFKTGQDTRPLVVTRTHPQTLEHVRSQVLGILEEDTVTMGERFREQATKFTEPSLVKDRKSLLRTYSRCFVGKEFVDWLLRSGEVESRNEAVVLGQRLLDAGSIEHVSKETKFDDKEQYYKFVEAKHRCGSGGEENGHEDDLDSLPDVDPHVTAAIMAYQPEDSMEPYLQLKPVTVLVTRTHIALVEHNPQWPFPRYLDPAPALKGPQFVCLAKYQMTDVTGLEFFEDSPCYVGICLSEEDSCSEVHWLLKAETVSSLSSLLKAIKEPWEAQFGVELQTTLHPTLGD